LQELPAISARGGTAGKSDGGEPILVCMAEIEPEEITWLWHPYMPEGALVMLDGDPGVGKSYLALAIAASISRGVPLPEHKEGR
jgi:hypothetical protein